jgi:hypothetical protein
MLKPPGEDESGSNSPANSITSINSLASLLREKMQVGILEQLKTLLNKLAFKTD